MTTPRDPTPQDEALASWLCAYDEAHAEGRPDDAPAESDLPPELRPRWRRATGCVDQLNRLWPRDAHDPFATEPRGPGDSDRRAG